jgi:hypothetical protein
MKATARLAFRQGLVLGAGLLLATGALAARNTDWEQVFLNGPIDVVLPDGTTRTVEPSCSGGPVLASSGLPMPGDRQFSFFVKRGNPNKLLVGFDGGGACWNATTCIGSVLAGSPTYSRVVDETPEQLAASGGVFDDRNPANPFGEYTKVFIPYCTADVHWGARESTYVLPLPGGGSLPWTLHHRGSDNLIAVVDWLKRNGRNVSLDLPRVRDLTVTGLSAGAYGTLNGFGYFAAETPRARLNIVADAGIGVLTSSFYAAALYNPAGTEVWGPTPNLPTWVPGIATMLPTASANPNLLVPLAFQSMARWRPAGRYASITADLDLVQIGFYGLMKGTFSPGPVEAAEWYAGMRAITAATAAGAPNYRYYIESGTFHTFLASDPWTYGIGVHGISVAEWIRSMTKPGNRGWGTLVAPAPF